MPFEGSVLLLLLEFNCILILKLPVAPSAMVSLQSSAFSPFCIQNLFRTHMHTLCNKHSVNHFLEILTLFIVYKTCLLKCFYVAFFLLPELPLVTVLLCKFMLPIILYHPDMETLLLARALTASFIRYCPGVFSANLSSP